MEPSLTYTLSSNTFSDPKTEPGWQSRTPREGPAFGHQWGLLHQPLSRQCHEPHRCLRDSTCPHCAEVWTPSKATRPVPLLPDSALCLTGLASAADKYLFLLVYQCWSRDVSVGLNRSVIEGWSVEWLSECVGLLPPLACLIITSPSKPISTHSPPSTSASQFVFRAPLSPIHSTYISLLPLPPFPIPSRSLAGSHPTHFSSSLIFRRVEDEGPVRSPSPGELQVLSPLSPMSPEPPGAPVPQSLQPGSLLSPPDSEAYYGETDSDADGPATQEKPRRPRRRGPTRPTPPGAPPDEVYLSDSPAEPAPAIPGPSGQGESRVSSPSSENGATLKPPPAEALLLPHGTLRPGPHLIPMVGPVSHPVAEDLTTTYTQKAKQASECLNLLPLARIFSSEP